MKFVFSFQTSQRIDLFSDASVAIDGSKFKVVNTLAVCRVDYERERRRRRDQQRSRRKQESRDDR